MNHDLCRDVRPRRRSLSVGEMPDAMTIAFALCPFITVSIVAITIMERTRKQTRLDMTAPQHTAPRRSDFIDE